MKKDKRPKAWLGTAAAITSAVASMIGSGINAHNARRARREQEIANNYSDALNTAEGLNNILYANQQTQDNLNERFLYAKQGKRYNLSSPVGRSKSLRTPYITDGGYAVPIGDGMNYLVGRTHEQRGRDGKTGIGIQIARSGGKGKQIEAENNEVEFQKGGSMYILSAQPHLGLNGMSPAELAAGGIVPKEQAFSIQESNKKQMGIARNGIKTPIKGSRKAQNPFYGQGLSSNGANRSMRLGGKKSINTQDRPKALTGAQEDLLSSGISGIASLANSLITANAYRGIHYPRRPVLFNPSRFSTYYNIAPQLSEIDYARQATNDNVLRNTVSSAAAREQIAKTNTSSMLAANEQWGIKTNKENELYNQDVAQRNQYGNLNTERLNKYYSDLVEAQNDRRLGITKSITEGISGLANAANTYFVNRRTDEQNRFNGMTAIATAHPEVFSKLTSEGVTYNNVKYILNPQTMRWEAQQRNGGRISMKHSKF